ncbi:DUF2637 domain-containing protein [Saccharopolyspora rhizosphaerae]|uniref:DUF2637 domain-containing protein n=1 Tax=Saccharopolyspora rhizosphaerae TaxID=2492662 RepID=A0A426JVL7_9PSEU|nr:DUF2637 domain-containing protein [Saccharopolyspora rhizosphaerae]RRO17240.1 DUF2637 domain-containing protein [Saccharopolyspora rhizosphaerae]
MSEQPSTRSGHGLWLSRAALGFVALAALMGWGASFVGLHAYGQEQMVGFSYWTAWLIPATFDGAAFGATLITYRASIYGRSAVRGRLLMWIFTAISSWINWIHQLTPEARLVAAGLPVAAVAVFDVVLAELRADFEERHGKRRLRLRPGLLVLRWLVDRDGTAGAFRRQVTDIPVSEIAGLGKQDEVRVAPAPEPAPVPAPVAAAAAAPAPAPEPARAETTNGAPQPPRPTQELPRQEGEEPAPEPVAREPEEPATAPEEPVDDTRSEAVEPEGENHPSSSEQTLTLPPVPADPLSDEDKRTFARRDYRLSLEVGEPITGAQLGHRYGFSERWGRRQIAAVRVEMEQDEEERDLVPAN